MMLHMYNIHCCLSISHWEGRVLPKEYGLGEAWVQLWAWFVLGEFLGGFSAKNLGFFTFRG